MRIASSIFDIIIDLLIFIINELLIFMKNKKFTIVALLFTLLAWTTSVWAQNYKVFGSHYAFDNNFNNSTINVSYGTGSTAEMTVSYNFSSGSLYGYPAICHGWHYGWNPANDYMFPIQLSAASSIPCYFSWNAGGSNMTGDFAYDMFLRWDNATGGGQPPQLEVMVWGDNNSWPIGNLTASNVLTQGGITFDLWEGYNSAAGYYVFTFVPHQRWGSGYSITQSGSLNVDMKAFFNWLQNNRSNQYNNSMYLHVVEAGLEITGGNGWAYVNANINAYKGSSTSYVQIQNRATGLMIDGMGRTSNGDNCGQWGNSGSTNQQWTIESYNGNVRIKNRATGLYLDGYGYTSNGSVCKQYGNSGSSNQQWVQESYNGYVRFKNVATGLYLDGYGYTNNGADLNQYGNSGSYNQQWSITSFKSAKVNSEELSTVAEKNSDVLLYPNPLLDGKLNIDLSGTKGNSQIKLIDLSGKVLKQISTSNQSIIQMDVDAKPGVYIIQISNNEKNTTKKLIVK